MTSRSYRRVRSLSQTPSSPKLLTPTRLRWGSSRVSTSWTEASSIALRRPSSSTFLEIWWKPRTRFWVNEHPSILQTTGHWPWLQARDSSRARQGTPLFIPWHKNYLAQMVRKSTPRNGPSSSASRYDL